MTRSVRWRRRQGDTAPNLDYVLRDHPAAGDIFGLQIDLSTVSSVIATVHTWPHDEIVTVEPATVVGPPTDGAIEVPTTLALTGAGGLLGVEFVATWPSAIQRVFPTSGPAWLLIEGSVHGQGLAPPPSSAPLFVGDGGSGTVTTDGQVVLAGASTTIDVAVGVTWFTLAHWDTQTPWTAGTIPTITQTGTTVDPSVDAALTASSGAPTVIARNGTVWYAAGSTSSGALPEIGHGSTLPVDGSVFQFFDLEGHPTLPNGLYRWDEQATVWVQI